MAGENGESIGLPPEATQPPVETPPKDNLISRIGKWFSHKDASPEAQANAMAGTNAAQAMPEAAAAMAAQVTKTEQPVLSAQSTPVAK